MALGVSADASVEILGDRWSLLIIRDMMLRGFRTYKEFLDSYEGIATNILADRLRKLIAHGIIATQPDPSDGRKLFYLLTAKGLDLAPVLTEWCSGPPHTRIPITKRLSVKSGRTRSNSWLRCGNAGPERLCLLLSQLGRWAFATSSATI